MKKIIALVLALVMVFALCACGNKTEAPSNNTTTPSNNTTTTPSNNTTTTPANNDKPATADEPTPEPVKWPTGDVTIYAPCSVGAPQDLAVRVMADYLTEKTGYNFIVQNDEVGAGYKASETVRKAKADGQTLLAAGAGQICSYYNGSWDGNVADPADFTICCVSIQQRQPSGALFCTPLDTPYDTWEEFVDYVKANPGTVNVGIVNGTPHEVRLKLTLNYFGIGDKVKYVSCTNTDVNTGILGGSIQLACLTETVGPQYVTNGDLKGLLYCNYERTYKLTEKNACLPDIPMTADIVKDHPEKLCCAWDLFLCGPAGMSDELCEAISSTMNGIVDEPEWMERVYGLGGTNDYVPVPLDQLRAAADLAEEQINEAFGA